MRRVDQQKAVQQQQREAEAQGHLIADGRIKTGRLIAEGKTKVV